MAFGEAIRRVVGQSSAPAPGSEVDPEGTSGTAHPPDLKTLAAQARAARNRAGGAGRTRKLRERLETEADVEQLRELFEGENWEEVAALYFDARFAMTGYDDFLLSEKQRKVLGVTLGASMKMLLAIDPRWVAVAVFGINFTAYIADKETRWYVERTRRDAKAKRSPTT